jgi:hypothetical protein
VTLRPFWRYYGGKWRAAPKYPKPKHDVIIEPFAGAAGYSLRYPERQVILVERYHVIAEIWRYLIGADPEEIRATPADIEHVDALPDWTPQGLRWLVGFCMNSATTAPCKQLSIGRKRLARGDFGAKSNFEGWSEAQRERVASQVSAIRHWTVIEGDYSDAPDVEATWYVDPPYQVAGVRYKHSSKDLDFNALGTWCRSRRGLVIVCEADGADWLPFRPFAQIKSFGAAGAIRTSAEVIWTPRLLDMVGM